MTISSDPGRAIPDGLVAPCNMPALALKTPGTHYAEHDLNAWHRQVQD
jgi:hypothetical protein